MKTITLKTDDIFFEKISNLAKNLHISKSELIREAIKEYEKNLYKKNLKKKVQDASFKVRDSIKDEMKDWEVTNLDGLKYD